MLTTEPARQGIRATGPLTSLVANDTGVACFVLTAAARTAIIRKIHIQNRGAAATIVTFGSGVGAQTLGDLPGYWVGAGLDRQITEEEIPAWEAIVTITAAASIAAAAPADVRVAVECEVFIGT